MTLKQIVESSNYVTDEELTDSFLLGMANTAMAEVNAFCGCLLPLWTNESLNDPKAYTALVDSWQIRLIEPYYSYSIAANDGDANARDFHYERFLQALRLFKDGGAGSGGLGDIDKEYKGDSERYKEIDVSDITVHWMGWI